MSALIEGADCDFHASVLKELEDERRRRIQAEEELASLKKEHEALVNHCEKSREHLGQKGNTNETSTEHSPGYDRSPIPDSDDEEYPKEVLRSRLNDALASVADKDLEIRQLKRQLLEMRISRERMANQVEAEEESLSLNFLRKMKNLQREKNELELQLSLSRGNSRSNSIDYGHHNTPRSYTSDLMNTSRSSESHSSGTPPTTGRQQHVLS